MKDITEELLTKYEKDFFDDNVNLVAMNAVTSNGIDNSCKNYKEIRDCNHNFSISIDAGDITNQKQSGRCWMFSALNMMRIEVMHNLNLKTMELSQSYPLFFDKLEKSNYFLENIIETKSLDLDSREVSFLLQDPLQDGGQFDMFKNIVIKYGVVPKEAMPEVFSSSSTRNFDKYLTSKLRQFAEELRNDNSSIEELRNKKDKMLKVIYRMLSISLGVPPKAFTYEVRDKNNKFIRIENITPQDFYKKYVNLNLDDYVSIINSPTKDKPYGKTYTVKYLGNVYGKNVKYLNLPIGDLKDLVIKQLSDNKSVWFGSDVSKFSTREEGILSTDILQVNKLFSTDIIMNKANNLDYGESKMNHAMLFTGVNLDNNKKPNRYRVENSWGKDVGKDGFYVMTDKWFDEYVYQVVINKKYLTNEQLQMYNEKEIILPPWDPMGSLAKDN